MDISLQGSNDRHFIYDVFISYSSRDRAWVSDRLLAPLETAGLKVCIDYRNFTVGIPTLENIEQAVENSYKTLLVLTPSWLSSEWTNFEVLLAQTRDPAARGRRLLPLLVVKTELPKRLQMLSYLDITETSDFDFQIKRLINDIRNTDAIPDQLTQNSNTNSISAINSISSDFNYLRGLARMSQQIKATDIETQLTFATLNSRLRANIHDENIFGSSESIRSDRNRIVHELNRLGLTHLQQTFNEMCST
ncbi:MAG: toll/interleukin-1 receptor domain-containing protein [Aulosira sp. DedQUE10]|nr:toll/interleukin-1 receptor domain-containing protein [Aulosira sp. DedQUE10]